MSPGLLARRGRAAEEARLADRLAALSEATRLSKGRVPAELSMRLTQLAARADQRLKLSGASTVVALAGATGSGKSSTFNALTGSALATVGVRRPTTSTPMACTWGSEPTDALLDVFQVPRRHTVPAGGASAGGVDLDGLVLIDLPDHDSTERAHQVEVDRMVKLVDMLVWVVDPQKYADGALHERYLRPLAAHAEVMVVVLNQIDKLTPTERNQCLKDLRRLLDSEGLSKVEVLGISALTGDGLPALRKLLAKRVAGKQAAAQRLAADVGVAAGELARISGLNEVPSVSKSSINALNQSLAEASAVPVVVEAVGKAWRLRGGLATGWPVLAWVAKFKPDPLRRLHLDRLGAGRRQKEIDPATVGRTSLPATTGVQRSRADVALRALADDASAGLTRGWADAVKQAARASADRLPDQLDRAVASTDLDLAAHRGWWQIVRVLQWLLVTAVVGGLLWLGSAFVLAYLQLPPLPPVTWWNLPAPTVLTVGGVLAGLLVAGLARIGVEVGARRRAAGARRALRRSIAAVTSDLTIIPVQAELDRYAQARDALQRAT